MGAGTEDEIDFGAVSTDPSGALRTATREARALLGDPPPCDPSALDIDAVLQAALGRDATKGLPDAGNPF